KEFGKAEEFAAKALQIRIEIGIPDFRVINSLEDRTYSSESFLKMQLADCLKAQDKNEKAKEQYLSAMTLAEREENTSINLKDSIKQRIDQLDKINIPNRELHIRQPETHSKIYIERSYSKEAFDLAKIDPVTAIEKAKSKIDELYARSAFLMNSHLIAQFYHVAEKVEDSLPEKSLELVQELIKCATHASPLAQICLRTYEDWLKLKLQATSSAFDGLAKALASLKTPDQKPEPDSGLVVDLLRGRALVCSSVGRLDIARALLEHAMTLRKTELNNAGRQGVALCEDDPIHQTLILDYIVLLIDLQETELAEPLLEELICKPQLPRMLYSSWNKVYEAFKEQNQWSKAKTFLAALLEKIPANDLARCQLLLRLAQVHNKMNCYQEAEQNIVQAVDRYPAHLSRIEYDAAMAEAQEQLNIPEAAIASHLMVANGRDNGREHGKLMLYSCKKALQMQEQLYGNNDVRVIPTLNLLSQLSLTQGDKETAEQVSARLRMLEQNGVLGTPDEQMKSLRMEILRCSREQAASKALEAQQMLASIEKLHVEEWGTEYLSLTASAFHAMNYEVMKQAFRTYIDSPAFMSGKSHLTQLFAHNGVFSGLAISGRADEAIELLRLALEKK
ncbi:MAG: hypothetical protein K2X81_00595, partial [Candidatus Obscuribacterales bacterium]|nr:hypothetical protein [Candidatus Obscuribacterales bacterium]